MSWRLYFPGRFGGTSPIPNLQTCISHSCLSSLFPSFGSSTSFTLKSTKTLLAHDVTEASRLSRLCSGFGLLHMHFTHCRKDRESPAKSWPPLPPPQIREVPKLGSRSHRRSSVDHTTTIGYSRRGSLSPILTLAQCHGKITSSLFHVCSQWLEDKHLIKCEVISGTQLWMKHTATPAWFPPSHSRPDKTAFSGTKCNSHCSRRWQSKRKNTNLRLQSWKYHFFFFFFLPCTPVFLFQLAFYTAIQPCASLPEAYNLWPFSNEYIYI